MRKLVLMVGLVVVAFACSEPLGEMLMDGGQAMMDAGNGMMPDAGAETPGDGSSMQYVGKSSRTYLGTATIDNGQVHQGIYTYYAACQDTFGPGYRMCTEEEIIFTTQIPQLSAGFAWYDPRAHCDAATGQRTAVNRLGHFSLQGCGEGNRELPIACCGPK